MNFIDQILLDLQVELSEEFDRNFERKAFFNKKWKPRKQKDRGSLLLQTGTLRRSIKAKRGKNSISFTSSLPYADIHNSGGTITITRKIQRFAWKKHYEHARKIKYRKDGTLSQEKTTRKRIAMAEGYKSIAQMKVGYKIKIPKRQFIGSHPQVHKSVKKIVDNNVKELDEKIKQMLKNNKLAH